MNSNMTEQLDQLFRMWDRGLCPGAQVLIRQHGKTLYEKCFGYGNLENKLKIHKESIFRIDFQRIYCYVYSSSLERRKT